jgi:hypothetical protein
MKPISTASLQCGIAHAEVTMLAFPTFRALLSTLEGKAWKLMMIRWISLFRGQTALIASKDISISY